MRVATAKEEAKMLCFEVRVNGEKVCVAGVGDCGHLAAEVIWAQWKPAAGEAVPEDWEPSKPWLLVRGSAHKEHLHWTELAPSLEVGDTVTFSILEADAADEPLHRKPHRTSEQAAAERYEQYKLLKREFEGDESIAAPEPGDWEASMRFKKRLMREYKNEVEAWQAQRERAGD